MVLEVKKLAYKYRQAERETFRDVNIQLEEGEILTILGPNGAGKSTLLNCIANLLNPTGGEVYLNGKPRSQMSLKEIAQVVGYVPQNHAAMYAYNVRDFVVMGRAPYLRMLQKPSENDYAVADGVMDDLGMQKYKNKPYTEISGGERQQALIARAITQEPKIIMFDEPTNHLDFGNQMKMILKLKELAQKGYAIIMTTHMPNHAMMLGGKTAILDRTGKLRCGKTEEVITEKTLRDIYQVDVRLIDVEAMERKVCVFGNL